MAKLPDTSKSRIKSDIPRTQKDWLARAEEVIPAINEHDRKIKALATVAEIQRNDLADLKSAYERLEALQAQGADVGELRKQLDETVAYVKELIDAKISPSMIHSAIDLKLDDVLPRINRLETRVDALEADVADVKSVVLGVQGPAIAGLRDDVARIETKADQALAQSAEACETAVAAQAAAAAISTGSMDNGSLGFIGAIIGFTATFIVAALTDWPDDLSGKLALSLIVAAICWGIGAILGAMNSGSSTVATARAAAAARIAPGAPVAPTTVPVSAGSSTSMPAIRRRTAPAGASASAGAAASNS
ncbi:MAG: hypothetical protein WCI47_00695 [bacterium]